ncbi:hypothetical protein NEOKW01_0215 [Nematocida sp. AWRm80]|nr:hypothetical protein NEOKW01_0215 [Nematocida sp. AWRm80]
MSIISISNYIEYQIRIRAQVIVSMGGSIIGLAYGLKHLFISYRISHLFQAIFTVLLLGVYLFIYNIFNYTILEGILFVLGINIRSIKYIVTVTDTIRNKRIISSQLSQINTNTPNKDKDTTTTDTTTKDSKDTTTDTKDTTTKDTKDSKDTKDTTDSKDSPIKETPSIIVLVYNLIKSILMVGVVLFKDPMSIHTNMYLILNKIYNMIYSIVIPDITNKYMSFDKILEELVFRMIVIATIHRLLLYTREWRILFIGITYCSINLVLRVLEYIMCKDVVPGHLPPDVYLSYLDLLYGIVLLEIVSIK